MKRRMMEIKYLKYINKYLERYLYDEYLYEEDLLKNKNQKLKKLK